MFHSGCGHSLSLSKALLTMMTIATLFRTSSGEFTYPAARRMDHTDAYHGTNVADPYRWLEDDVRTSKEVEEWVTAQNKITFAYLEGIPQREKITQRLTSLWNYEKYSAPFKEAGKYFYFKNDGLQNQSVMYSMDGLEAEPTVVLDPNSWSADGTVALSGMALSDDGKYLAYGTAEAGSDWNVWRILSLDTKQLQGEELRWVKFSQATWTKDSKGFFYGRYDEPKEGAAFQSLNLNQKIYYHRVGTPQSDDVLVYQRPDQPEYGFGTSVSEDGRYLVISTWKGTDAKNLVHFRDLSDPYAIPMPIIENMEFEFEFVGNDGPIFYFKTSSDAPRGRVIAIDTRKPQRENWREIIPQTAETLIGVSLVGNVFVADYLKDAHSQIKIHDLRGKLVREVELPGLGTASGFGGHRDDTETFYVFNSITTPPTIYRYDLLTGSSTVFKQTKVDFDSEQYEVKQVFYQSKDGTRVPMFIAHKKGLALDGSHPTLLYGYGGFNISLTPNFSVARLGWLELGGVFAMPNLRGGGEYGEAWHEAGKLERKQNVFDDFIGAAEWLIANKYTRPDKLAIQGRSNGGLLVGACMTQRPDLFGACLPGVGVMDMLRFHQFTAGRFWVDEFGSADNPAHFEFLRKYSPYHNIKDGTQYPATLIVTADTDDRVVPGHSFKFAAALQQAQKGGAPVLIRIETRAGHGAGKPTTKQIEEVADEWSFLVKALNVEGT
jgi:prolyl oligopeptidase